MKQTPVVLVSLACCVLALQSCGGTSDRRIVSGSVDPDNVSPQRLETAPKVTDATGAREDVVLDGCPVDGATASARGTVVNSTKEAADYAITISWVNDRSDVMARAVAVVNNLGPGERRTWKVSAPAGKADNDNCTVFAQRGTVRSQG